MRARRDRRRTDSAGTRTTTRSPPSTTSRAASRRSCARRSAPPTRPRGSGRDEFAVSFWDVEREVVEKTLRRIISGIASLAAEDPEARVSASIGVAYFFEPPRDPNEALRRAEKALHLARDSGRGILHVWQQEVEDDPASPRPLPTPRTAPAVPSAEQLERPPAGGTRVPLPRHPRAIGGAGRRAYPHC